MSSSISVKRQFSVRRQRHGRKSLQVKIADGIPKAAILPRVARLLALAIRFDQLIRDGVVADQAELARLGHVSRARLTQIMNLLNLAPDLQDAVLHLRPVSQRHNAISERNLRPIAATPNWLKQRRMWIKYWPGDNSWLAEDCRGLIELARAAEIKKVSHMES